MNNRKIFISINLDEATKKHISEKISVLKNRLDANWTFSEQYHVTMSFIGFVSDETVSEICQSLRIVLEGFDPFDLSFESIILAPSIEKPKMLWMKGNESRELMELGQKIDQVLKRNPKDKQMQRIHPHVTLARLKIKQDLSQIEMAQLVGQPKIKVAVPVVSVDVMESIHEKGIWKHYPLEQIEL